MLKFICLAGGLAGAVGLSQYPEFTQQYIQRLAGQVDALSVVVDDFEASAMRSGLTRTQAFEQMTGTQFLADRQTDMRRTFARHAVLTNNLAELRAATPLSQLTMPQRLADTETFANTWDDFKPAVPLSVAGVVAAGAGGVFGWVFVGAILALLGNALRRRPKVADATSSVRKKPALRRSTAPTSPKPNTQPLVGRR